MTRAAYLLAALLALGTSVSMTRANDDADASSGPAFPLKAGGDGRCLVDARGRPFFYHADTAWNLPKKLTLAEAEEYFADRRRRGFTAVQLQAVSKEQGPPTNRGGRDPFVPLDDVLKPDDAYWRHFDQVLDAARRRGLFVAIAPLWIRWGGTDKEGWRNQLTEQNAKAYGRFLGQRYRRLDNLMWILGGDANPKEKTGAIRLLAAGIRDAAPHHLLTVHNAPENSSAAFFDEPWLDVNMAYTYHEVHPHVLAEHARTPPRPIVLGESGYEGENNDKRGGDPWRMRRQAYGAFLNGALGGHAFGQKHVWRCDADWRAGLDSPASRQMAHVKELFASRPWYALAPDGKGECVVDGRGAPGDVGYVSAAATTDGKLVIVYTPEGRAVTVDLSRLAGPVRAQWFDPADGRYRPAEGSPFNNRGRRSFQPPGKNAAGDADFVLVLEAVADR